MLSDRILRNLLTGTCSNNLLSLTADHWSVPPEQDIVFGYHVHLDGGKVMKLETPTFNEHWGSRGGLGEFQNHVLKALKLKR